MHRLTRIVMPMALALLPMAINAADWPGFLGPKGNGFSAETGIKKNWNERAPKMLWSVPLTDGGYAGPSVAGGKVFIIDHQGANDVVRAIDIKTGKDAWTYKYEDTKAANYGYSRATPLVLAGKVYVNGRLGLVTCLDAKTGKKVWDKDIKATFNGKNPQWEYAISPFIDSNKLIVCPGGPDASVAALDAKTGDTIWKGGGSDIPSYATPVMAMAGAKKLYIVMTGVSLIGVDAADGKLLWNIPWKTSYDINGATPIVMGNTIFITAGYGHGCALVEFSATEAKILWENKDMVSRFSTPLLYNGYLYCTEDSGNLVCMDAKTGTVAWKQPGFEWGGAVGIDGVAIVFDGKGGDLIMAKLSPEKYEELGRFKPLGDQSWTAPIISDGNLIVRNKTALAAFSLK
ncbi:MAG: PQQ-binding-like beta-propeller repeat protein [Armatimonadetes bacterium]|nr:PQQ-binding-like beta-propeller repeat protein [Armatimonadota bacterium]